MEIGKIFARSLDRPINGVVKADQLGQSVVFQELDEYVITRELDKHFRKFFETYSEAIKNPNNPAAIESMGVWISGFFGSGKSHFIKILSYLLENRSVVDPDGENRNALSFFKEKIDDPTLLADITLSSNEPTEVALFNIDSKADTQGGEDAILRVFLRVFNEIQGFCGDHPHIAHMERQLESRGKLGAFKAHFCNRAGNAWEDERDAYAFMQEEIVQALSEVLGQSTDAALNWYEGSEQSFREMFNIENFSKWVKAYLDSRGAKHRIVFLVDEVGQFIGGNGKLMLNLQTITENLGTACEGKAWVIVTSQEDIDAVLGEFRTAREQDFSKIQGRFKTRLSLSSANTDEVIQKRLLEKNNEVIPELSGLFDEKGDILRNQISFSDAKMTFSNFTDSQSFVVNYPFAPYHFQLVQKVFESIRKAGATGVHLSRGERSMLDAFQHAALSIKKQAIGALVPLYHFYPSIESFLDTAIKRTIEQADESNVLESFDAELLRVLFLIRYVDVLKGNVDNLVTLCLKEIDADRLALRRQIEESLVRLEKQNLINRSGDIYYFLTNEERDVSREIRNVDIVAGEETRLLTELVFEDLFQGMNKHRYVPNRSDMPVNRICDGHVFGGRGDHELSIAVITPMADDYMLFEHDARCILQSNEHQGHVLIRLPDDKDLSRELGIWLKTDKYIRARSDDSNPDTYKRILRDRAEENRDRKVRLMALLEDMFTRATTFVAGQKLEIKAADVRAGLSEALDYLVENTFSKLGYLEAIQDEPLREIKAVLLANNIDQQGMDANWQEGNAKAMGEVRDFLDLSQQGNHRVVLDELVERFKRRPYGWPEWETVLLVARLAVAGEISLIMDEPLEPRQAIEPLSKTMRWKLVKIEKMRRADAHTIAQARLLGRDMFQRLGSEDGKGLFDFLREDLQVWRDELNRFYPLANTGRYPGKKDIEQALALLDRILSFREPATFLERLLDEKQALLEMADDIHDLSDFYNHQRAGWDALLVAYEQELSVDRISLERNEQAHSALNELEAILQSETPYGMIASADALVKKLRSILNVMLNDRRALAMRKADEKIDEIKQALEAVKADVDLCNQCLHPLQRCRIAIEKAAHMAAIIQAQDDARSARDNALDAIQNKQNRVKEADSKPVPVAIVYPNRFSGYGDLENEADVENYLACLREELLMALRSGKRIRIR